MKNKRLLMLALLLATALLVAACTPAAPQATPEPTAAPAAEEPAAEEPADETAGDEESALLELTEEELAKFNGKDGQPAYIAVDGVIYDVSNHPAWKEGGHNGYEAGKDLTTEIKEKSPHGVGKLTEATEVGKLVP